MPFSIENDGKSAALAEKWGGNLKNIHNGAATVLGTGVGGGIIINDNLYLGSHFQAGEFSFMIKETSNEKLISYGSDCSAVSMIEHAGKLLNLSDYSDGNMVFEYLKKNDVRVMPIFKKYCKNVAILISNIKTVLDIDCFVIGGGISAQPLVTKTINQQYQTIRKNYPSMDKTIVAPKIISSKFHNDANLYGAFYSLLLKYD